MNDGPENDRRRLQRIDTVIPAHDEERLIAGCLDGLILARAAALRERPWLEVGLTIVLDDCTDDTAEVVAEHLGSWTWPVEDVRVLRVDERNVGAARRIGCAFALDDSSGAPENRWLATSDADSRVPEDWLLVHAAAFDAGTDVLLGTVRPDFADLSADDVARWTATHPPGHLPGNVHGANLGIRADRYLALGGFAALGEHEDVDLVERAGAAGFVVAATSDGVVETSGRRVGRTPGGYAAFLAERYPTG